MSDFNFNVTITKAAKEVKRLTKCPEHGTPPEFEIVKTSKGAEVKWTFCCEKLAVITKDKFTRASTKYMGEAINDSLKNIFKR